MSRLHELAALLLLPWLAGCLDVPQVTFVAADAADDARSDATGVPDDGPAASDASDASMGAQDGTGDVAVADADADATAIADTGPDDASDGGMCPGSIPPGAAWCCGSVPCKGTAAACQAECTNCENNCSGQSCCLDKNGNYHGCAATPAACP